MKRIGSLVILAVSFHVFGGLIDSSHVVAQPDGKNDATAQRELDKLQGLWHHVSREEAGKQILGEAKDVLIVVRGNVVVFKKGTEVSQVVALKNIDVAANPKTVDLVITDGSNEGMTIHAIFEIKDGFFRICGGVNSRPSSFTTQPDNKGYVYCSSYKRVKRQ